eukprot:6186865-Pleurochrysis_carterae.AAC.2
MRPRSNIRGSQKKQQDYVAGKSTSHGMNGELLLAASALMARRRLVRRRATLLGQAKLCNFCSLSPRSLPRELKTFIEPITGASMLIWCLAPACNAQS